MSYSSPHQQWPPPLPGPVSRITVTRDYAHGKTTPRDDNQLDLFSKGLADIERRRALRHSRKHARSSASSDVHIKKERFEGDHGHSYSTHSINSAYQSQDATKHEFSQGLPDHDGRYYDQPSGGSYGNGDKTYRYEHDYQNGGSSYWDDQKGGYPNHEYVPENNYNHPAAEMFQEELQYLDGDIERERTNPAVGYECDVCRISVNSVSVLQTHFAGSKHKKALAKRGMSNALDDLVKLPKDETVRKSILRCTLCNVIIQGTEMYLHSMSEQHQEMLISATPKEMIDKMTKTIDGETGWYETVDVQNEGETEYQRYKCAVCDLMLPNRQSYELHVQGKKHEKKLRWTNSDNRDPDDGGYESAQFWCSICCVFCSTANDLDKHFSGKQHAKILRTKGVSKEVIHDTLPENTKLFPTIPDPPTRALNLYDKNLCETKPKPKKGLYGSLLSETLPSPHSSFSNEQRPSTSSQLLVSPPVAAGAPPPPEDSGERTLSLSVGAFLRSINGEDPTPKKKQSTTTSHGAQSSVVSQLASKKHFTHRNPAMLVQYPVIKRRRYT